MRVELKADLKVEMKAGLWVLNLVLVRAVLRASV